MIRSTLPPDLFRFGWRNVQQIGPDGVERWYRCR